MATIKQLCFKDESSCSLDLKSLSKPSLNVYQQLVSESDGKSATKVLLRNSNLKLEAMRRRTISEAALDGCKAYFSAMISPPSLKMMAFSLIGIGAVFLAAPTAAAAAAASGAILLAGAIIGVGQATKEIESLLRATFDWVHGPQKDESAERASIAMLGLFFSLIPIFVLRRNLARATSPSTLKSQRVPIRKESASSGVTEAEAQSHSDPWPGYDGFNLDRVSGVSPPSFLSISISEFLDSGLSEVIDLRSKNKIAVLGSDQATATKLLNHSSVQAVHCIISEPRRGVRIITNGVHEGVTEVNGVRLKPDAKVVLNPHDEIRMGNVVYRYRNDSLELLSSDALTYRKLFPYGVRFLRFEQGRLGDCWLIAALLGLFETDAGSSLLTRSIRGFPNGVWKVDFPGYSASAVPNRQFAFIGPRDINTINGALEAGGRGVRGVNGPTGMQLFEAALHKVRERIYSRREFADYIKRDRTNALTGGDPEEIFNTFLAGRTDVTIEPVDLQPNVATNHPIVLRHLVSKASAPRSNALVATTFDNLDPSHPMRANHVYNVNNFDPARRSVIVTDPSSPTVPIHLSFGQFLHAIDRLILAHFNGETRINRRSLASANGEVLR